MSEPRLDPPETVLIVDDDDRYRSRLERAFADRQWRAFGAATPAQADAIAREQLIDLALVDLRLAEGSGLDVIASLHAADADTVILMLTGYGSIATAVTAVQRGAADYLTKPIDADQVLSVYRRVRAGVREAPPESVPSLDHVQWDHMHRVLADCGGNISHAARLLGLHRRTLQRKLRKRPLPGPEA